MEIVIFGLWFVIALVIGSAAQSRGRNGFGWFLLAIVLSPLLAGLLLLLFPTQLPSAPDVSRVNDGELQRNIKRSNSDHFVADVAPYDTNKWNALLKYDDEIADIAARLRPFGDRWVNEFASSYLALNDKAYIPRIIEKIIQKAREESAKGDVIVEQGVHRGRRWRRFSNGEIEAEVLGGGTKRFSSLAEFDAFISDG